jgi:hypothetical protein
MSLIALARAVASAKRDDGTPGLRCAMTNAAITIITVQQVTTAMASAPTRTKNNNARTLGIPFSSKDVYLLRR